MRYERKYKQQESGQALVLVALATVALVAIVALAVDGSMAFAQRRQAQNAADASAMSGAYELRVSKTLGGNYTEEDLLRFMIAVAESHGLEDSEGPIADGDAVNTNLTAYYTDTEGNRLTYPDDCALGTCLEIPEDAWGVHVIISKPFDTYFAGMIGWSRIRVGSDAIGVTHRGSRARDSRYWVMFGTDRQGCGPYEVGNTSSSSDITGNIHTNGSFNGQGNSRRIIGELTYYNQCNTCGPDTSSPSPAHLDSRIALELPTFNAYKSLAYTSALGTPQYTIGNKTVSSGRLGGTALNPYTYITGNLTVSGTNVELSGLIYVGGNVTIEGSYVWGSFTIISDGYITASGTKLGYQRTGTRERLRIQPFNSTLHPLLAGDVNTSLLWTNLNGGLGVCTNDGAVLNILGSENVVRGGLLAPFGRIKFHGAQNQLLGSMIGDTVDVAGLNNVILYESIYFPPQPDRIELLQ